MFETIEKALLTGLGAISLSQKMAEDMVKDLREKYKVSEEEGKAFLEKLQNMTKDSRARIEEMAEAEIRKAIDRIGLVPRDEFDRLAKRVAELERQSQESEAETTC